MSLHNFVIINQFQIAFVPNKQRTQKQTRVRQREPNRKYLQLSCSDLYLHLSTQLQKQLWSAPNYLIVMTERCFQQLIIIPLTWFDPYSVFPKSHSYKYLIILYNLVLVVLISSSCLTYTTSYRSYILARFTYTYSKWLLFPPLVWPRQPVFTVLFLPLFDP